MVNGRLDSTQFKESLGLLDKFTTKSKLYDFSNYIYIEGSNGELIMTAPIVLGEAISSGIASVRIPFTGEDFERVAVGKDDLKGIATKLKDEGITITVKDNVHTVVEIEVEGEATMVLATVDSVIPPMFNNNLMTLRREKGRPLPLDDVQGVVKELNKDLKTQVISHVYNGIYITDMWSFVTNNLYMTGHILPKDLGAEIFIPKHAAPIINAIPKGEYTYVQKVLGVDPTASPYLYIRGEGIELYFQEWVSKDIYPINQMISFAQMEGTQVSVEDITKVIKWIAPKTNLIKFNFQEGEATSLDGSVKVDIEVLDLPTTYYSKTVLPSLSSIKSYSEVEFIAGDFLKFNGALMSRICTPAEVSNE